MAKLTKEEKKALKEAKKLQKLAAAEEVRKKLKRDELQREMAAQRLRRSEMEQNWRQMMLKVKAPVFRQDVEVMWHTFERAFDKKDFLIQQILRLMEEADEQSGRTVSSFCETIDGMTNKFHSDLEDMSRDNEIRTKELLRRGEDEADKIMKDHNAAETHMQLLIYHARSTAEDLAWRVRGENLVKADEERDKLMNDRDDLRSFLENTYTLTWEEYKSVLKSYVTSTADNQKKVRRLRRKENIMSDIIASQAKRMVTNQAALKRLRDELKQYETGTKQAVFRDRRDRHRDAYWRMKHALEDGRAKDDEQLSTLVAAADVTSVWLESAHKKAEKILRMAAMCRKFETQREKVLPFDLRPPGEPLQCDKDKRGQTIGDSLVCEELSLTAGLSRLWEKIARAQVAREALSREKAYLLQENAMMNDRLREYREMHANTQQVKLCNCPGDKKPAAVEASHIYKRLV